MRLSMRTRFRLGAAFATFLLLIPLGVVMAQEAAAVSASRQGKRAYETFSTALGAAQYVSAERGPSNGALGAPLPLNADLAHDLVEARATSDSELEALHHAVRGTSGTADAAAWRAAETALATGRSKVDALLAEPLDDRTSDQIKDAVDAMASVIPHLFGIAATSLTAIPSGSSSSTTPLQTAVVVANLREQAGLLGSRLTPALVTRRGLTVAEQGQIDDSMGRIHQIVSVLDQQQGIATVRRARTESRLDSVYLGDGLGLFDRVRAVLSEGRTDLTPAQFATAYVPTMQPIIELRDAMVSAGRGDAEAASTKAFRDLLLAIGGSLLLITGSVAVMWRYERYIVGPIANAADAILDLVGEDLDGEVTDDEDDRPQHQVAALQRAITALSEHAHEQATRVKSLEAQANTDVLTGALNRRAMRAVFPTWRLSGPESHDLFAILDVDHFKQVNDTYGHPVGDEVLRHLVALAQSTFRPGDLVARIGGEEFAIFLKVDNPESGVAAIERFRKHVASTPIHLTSGEQITCTVSIGVAVAKKGTIGDVNTAFRRADRLLYVAKHNGRNRIEHG